MAEAATYYGRHRKDFEEAGTSLADYQDYASRLSEQDWQEARDALDNLGDRQKAAQMTPEQRQEKFREHYRKHAATFAEADVSEDDWMAAAEKRGFDLGTMGLVSPGRTK
jgi:hypothetical protein